jgi:hypothetical protein
MVIVVGHSFLSLELGRTISWENIPPSTCHSAISTQKVQIFFFFVLIDVHSHTWAHKIQGIEKLKPKKMIDVVPLFSTFETREWQCFGKFYLAPFVIVPFPHIKSKSFFFYFSRCSYSHMRSHNSWNYKKKTSSTKNKIKELDYTPTNY